MRKLIKLASIAKYLIFFSIILMILKMITTIVFITLLSNIIEYLYLNSYSISVFQHFRIEIITLGVLPLIHLVLSLSIRKFIFKGSSRIRIFLRKNIFQKLLALEVGYVLDKTTSQITNHVIDGVEALEVFYEEFLPRVFYAIFMPIILFVYFININLSVALILILGLPLIPGSIMYVQVKAKPLMKKYWENYSDVGSEFLDYLQGLNTLKNICIDDIKQEELNREFWRFRNTTMDVLKMQLKSILFMDSIAYGLSAIAIVVGLSQISPLIILNQGTISNSIIIILLSIEFFLPLRRLGSAFHAGMNGIAASHGIFDILEAKPSMEIKYSENNVLEETLHPNIEFKNVVFNYDKNTSIKRKRSIIDDISFKLMEGTTLAIVGDSGSGKSTLANLIARFYDVESGAIYFENIDIRELPINILRDNIAYVGSNTYIFAGTIEDNLRIVNKELTNSDLINACKLAGLSEFIEKNSLNYDVGEWGRKLSGGEKQRLGIARAILQDPSLFIFDEATSNIDVESEEIIWDSIHQICKTKTSILISHRLSSIKHADNIIVLKEGKIIEQGTHDELIEQNGYYKNGIESQAVFEECDGNQYISVDLAKSRNYEEKRSQVMGNSLDQANSQPTKTKNLRILSRLFKLLGNEKRTMIKCILFGILGHLSSIFLLSFSAMALANIMGFETLPNYILFTIIICLGILRGVLRFREQYHGHDVAFRLLALIRTRIFRKFRNLAPAKLLSKHSGDSIQMVQSDVETIETFFAHTISPVTIGIIVPIILLIFYSFYWIWFSFILLITYLIIGLLIPWISGLFGKRLGIHYRAKLAEINNHTLDSLQGLKDIILFNNHKKLMRKIDNNSQLIIRLQAKNKKIQNIGAAISEMTIFTGVLIIFILGLNYIQITNTINLAQLLIVIITSYSSFGPVLALVPLRGYLKNTLAAGRRIFGLLDEKPEVQESYRADSVSSRLNNSHYVNYDNVSFKYPNTNQYILEDVSLELNGGSKIAIIGESGSGKSTLLHLLLRYWDVNDGSINLSKINIKDIRLIDLRKKIALFSQDTYIFNRTIMENIKMGNYNASEEDIYDIAKRVNIHEFIMSLPEGYETIAGELGEKLSSGEAQRIGLARTLLQNRKIILLDEPTSNLDFLNEKLLLNTLSEQFTKDTVLMVSHRPSTIHNNNIIWKLEEKGLKLISHE
jgi:ATP-binding cassette subfamily B protein